MGDRWTLKGSTGRKEEVVVIVVVVVIIVVMVVIAVVLVMVIVVVVVVMTVLVTAMTNFNASLVICHFELEEDQQKARELT
jgi:ABC-type bacteriocin/lantibiotic exporter with double-glycine peptidase domain